MRNQEVRHVAEAEQAQLAEHAVSIYLDTLRALSPHLSDTLGDIRFCKVLIADRLRLSACCNRRALLRLMH